MDLFCVAFEKRMIRRFVTDVGDSTPTNIRAQITAYAERYVRSLAPNRAFMKLLRDTYQSQPFLFEVDQDHLDRWLRFTDYESDALTPSDISVSDCTSLYLYTLTMAESALATLRGG